MRKFYTEPEFELTVIRFEEILSNPQVIHTSYESGGRGDDWGFGDDDDDE